MANKGFLTGHSIKDFSLIAEKAFFNSLLMEHATTRYTPRLLEVLSKAELFCTVLSDEDVLFDYLYDTAMKEAKRRHNVVDERRLLVAKYFRYCGLFSSYPPVDPFIHQCFTDKTVWSAKLLCYHGIY